jgi:hypothetical protein
MGAVVLLIVMVVWKKDIAVDVTAHRWTREVDVERYDAVREDAWCDQLPGGAYAVTRTREVRDHKQIPDGQDCHDRHIDKGDGTFTVKQECTTKYRSEPVYGDKCHYSVDRWHVVRTEQAIRDARRAARRALLVNVAYPFGELRQDAGAGSAASSSTWGTARRSRSSSPRSR